MSENQQFPRRQSLMARILSSISFIVSEDVNTREQRISPRTGCRFAIRYVDENGVKGQALLIDMSKTGIQIETDEKLRKGITLALSAPEDETLERTAPFMAKVRWSRKGPQANFRSGLALPKEIEDDAHWLDALLHQIGYAGDGTQKREFIRASSEISAELFLEDSTQGHTVELLNLSVGGALLKSKWNYPKEAEFRLTVGPHGDLPALSLNGTVLRVLEAPEPTHLLYPSKFQSTKESDVSLLQEYILKFSDR